MKKILVGILLFFCSFMIINAEELDFNVSSNKINKGENLDIFIEPYDGNIEIIYDKNIFEEIDASNLKNAQVNSFENNTFHLNDKSSVQINLKLKDTAKKGITKVTVNYGNQTYSHNIYIYSSNIWVIYAIIFICLIIFTLIYYNKNKLELKKEQTIVISITSILAIVFLILCIFNLNVNFGKKDEVNYTLLIDKNNTIEDNNDNEENNPENNPGNNEENNENDNNDVVIEDTKETTTTTKSVSYKVNLKSFDTDTKVIEKNNEVIILFSVDVTPYKDIKSVVINNKTYNVKKVGNKYQVIVSTPNKYGNQKYTITNVILKNGKKIKVTNKDIEIYVLKTAPSIENINIDKRQEIPVLNFDIEDVDNTFVSGKVVMSEVINNQLISAFTKIISNDITNINDSNILLEENIIKSGHNTFEVPKLKEGMSYDLVITLEYNLNENSKDTTYSFEEKEEKKETFEREYNFKLTDEKITDIVTKDDSLNLSFKNGEYSYKDLEKITIDNKEYDLIKDNETNIYSVNNIEKCKNKGKCQINITNVKVTTESGIIKTIPCDYKIDYIYLKDEVNIDDFTVTYNDNKISGNVKLTDIDDTIKSGLLIIDNGSIKKRVELTKEDLLNGNFVKDLSLDKSGYYSVTLVVNYDLGDEKELNKEKLSPDKIYQNIVSTIKSIKVQDEKVARGSKADVYFTIESNTDENVQSITIDNKVYNVEKQSDGTYKVNVDVPENGSGLTRTLKVTKLSYSKEEINVNNDIVIDILKLVPSISTFTLSALGGQIYGEFTLNDEDSAVVGAKYTINGVTRTITSDEFKSLKFKDNEVRKARNYEVTLTLIYDLGNGITKTDISREESVIVEVDANITDVTVNPKYVKKGESVTITYTVKDNTDSELSKININGTDYEVTSLGNDKYSVSINISSSESSGLKEFTATTLTYADNKTFNLSNKCSVIVLKTEPTIGELSSTSYDKSLKTLTGEISVQENESEDTIVNGTLTITGPSFSKPYVTTISKENLLDGTFKIEDLDLSLMGDYTISLVVNYNLGEKDIQSSAKTSTVHIDLEAKIISVTAPSVINKSSNFELVYKIEDNTNNKVYKIKINGEEKYVDNSSSDDIYKVLKYSLNDESYGMHTITTSALIYHINQSDTEIAVSNKTQVYVLKDKPELKDITYNYKEDGLYANLDITDTDTSKTSTKITFTNINDDSATPFTVNGSEVNINTLKNGKYNVKVEINYDLDESNNFDGSLGVNTYDYENVNIITNYNPEVESFELTEITEDTVKLKAKITNDTDSQITSIKLNDGLYEVTTFKKLDDTEDEYLIEIANPKTRTELKITDIIFNTEYTKKIESSSTVIINKKVPSAIVRAQVVNDNKVKATIELTDTDTTINKEKYFAVLKKQDTDKEIERIKIESDDVTFTKSLEGAVNYKVEVIADYDLVDGKTYSEQVLATSSEKIIIPAQITYVKNSMTFTTPYSHTNNKEFGIKFKFESNVNLNENQILDKMKMHTSEYDKDTDGQSDGSTDGKNYEQVGIDPKDEEYSIKCEKSTKRENTDIYDSECQISYQVVNQSSVIKVNPISYTYNDASKDTNPITTQIENDSTKLIDVIKWHPKFEYTIENKYSDGQIVFKFKFLDDVSILQPFNDNVYLKIEYGATNRQEFKVDTLEANKDYTVTFNNIKPGDSGRRFNVSAYFDHYHGDIVNKNPERKKEINIASFIHFFYDQGTHALNNIDLVNEEGEDIEELVEGDQAKLSFGIDGSEVIPTKMTITIDDNNSKDYEVISNPRGGFITKDFITGLVEGTHTIKITNLTVNITSYSVSENNAITIEIKPKGTGISLSIPNKVLDLKTNQKLIFENKDTNKLTNKEINTEILKENNNVPNEQENIEEINLDEKTEENSNINENNREDNSVKNNTDPTNEEENTSNKEEEKEEIVTPQTNEETFLENEEIEGKESVKEEDTELETQSEEVIE